jgi:DNA repair protein RadC
MKELDLFGEPIEQQEKKAKAKATGYQALTITAKLMQVREAKGDKVVNPVDVVNVCEDLRMLAQEAFVIITLDAKNHMIDKHLVCLGILDATLVHPREVFRVAISDNAAAIVCAHNHPSGDPTPSTQDLQITRQLIEAGKVIDIKLLDHVIIGRETKERPGYLSLRENGLVNFA